MGTLKHKLDTMEEVKNPNSVKVITDKNDYAVYFSRSVIPYPRKEDMKNYYKHVGIYGYKRKFVLEYSKWEQTPLEIAVYFSRSVIPYPRKEDMKNYYKHVGIYGYKRKFVLEYSKWEQTPLEISESLEQLRVLENGYKIKVLPTPYKIIGVDTEAELERVREYISKNNLKI